VGWDNGDTARQKNNLLKENTDKKKGILVVEVLEMIGARNPRVWRSSRGARSIFNTYPIMFL
jgi:hypothetical protein